MPKFLIALLLVTQLFAAEYRLMRPQRVEIPCADLAMIATYYPVSAPSSNSVILIHGLGRNRGDWNELARYLQKEGIAALSFDLRGHGESIAADGRGWRSFAEADYQSLLADVETALDYAASAWGFAPGQTGVIGMGLGANLALQLAERYPQLAGAALLSPGLDYKSVKLPSGKYRRSLYVICSRFEKMSLEASEYLKENFPGKIKVDIYEYAGTVISLFLHRYTLSANLADWFKQVFAAAAA